jgi:hypothetical protein
MRRELLTIDIRIALRRAGFTLATLVRMNGHSCRGFAQGLERSVLRRGSLEPCQLTRHGIDIVADATPSEAPRLYQHGAAAAERIQHAVAYSRQARNQARRRLWVHTCRVAVKGVDVGELRGFGRRDVEGVTQGFTLRGVARELDGAAQLAQRGTTTGDRGRGFHAAVLAGTPASGHQ